MFVLRNIINHEIYTSDVSVDGEPIFGIAGWTDKAELEESKNEFIENNMGKYYVDDWQVLELDDKLYYSINHQLENDSDFKAYYYNSGTYEIFNTRTGKLIRKNILE